MHEHVKLSLEATGDLVSHRMSIFQDAKLYPEFTVMHKRTSTLTALQNNQYDIS